MTKGTVKKMAELIVCRECDSPSCNGCNIKILADMLKLRKLNALMNKNRRIDGSVDAVPVVHGRWLSNDPYVGWRCSVCERNNDYAYRWNYDESENEQQDYFCPHCGAKMDGGAE